MRVDGFHLATCFQEFDQIESEVIVPDIVDGAVHLALAILTRHNKSIEVTWKRNSRNYARKRRLHAYPKKSRNRKSKTTLRQQLGHHLLPIRQHHASRKHNRLGVHRSPISSNTLATKDALNIYPPGLIESDAASLHDNVYIALGILVQTCARIAGFDVLGQVEVGAV